MSYSYNNMTTARIMITELGPQYDEYRIAIYFWSKKIAKVTSVTIIPYVDCGVKLGIAYIDLTLLKTEAGKDFAKKLWLSSSQMNAMSGGGFRHKISEDEDDDWLIQQNTHNTGKLCVGNFTTDFDDQFYGESDECEVEEQC